MTTADEVSFVDWASAALESDPKGGFTLSVRLFESERLHRRQAAVVADVLSERARDLGTEWTAVVPSGRDLPAELLFHFQWLDTLQRITPQTFRTAVDSAYAEASRNWNERHTRECELAEPWLRGLTGGPSRFDPTV